MNQRVEKKIVNRAPKRTLLAIAIFFLSLTSFLSPVAIAKAVKHDRAAAKGCISKLSYDEALSALERFNLTTVNGSREEITALGTGLVWIEELNDGKPLDMAIYRGPNKYPFIFKNKGTHSQQTPAGIIISRRGAMKFGSNVAQLIHELGHLVGNQGGYADYYHHVGKAPCVVSGYSDDRFNEQFAEVFAAFVTRPNLIKRNPSAACKKAWNYFSNVLFSTGDNAMACIRGKTKELLARRAELDAQKADAKDENNSEQDQSPTQEAQIAPIDEFDKKRREEEYERSIEEAINLMLRDTTEFQPLVISDDE
ncbi:MAG: hypothetical protein RJB66_542 [Pseudomonadota bacterium]|jgi:hypothetical protein